MILKYSTNWHNTNEYYVLQKLLFPSIFNRSKILSMSVLFKHFSTVLSTLYFFLLIRLKNKFLFGCGMVCSLKPPFNFLALSKEICFDCKPFKCEKNS